MAYTPPDIQDAPSTATPLNASNIEAWLAGVAAYADTIVSTATGGVVAAPVGNATTDRIAIQTALNAASPGDVVKLAPGSVYEVNQATTKSFRISAGATTTLGYAIEIPTGVTLDTNGSTIKLAVGSNCVIVCNKLTTLLTDTGIGLTGFGTIDGAGINLTGCAAIWFHGVTGLTLDIRLHDTRRLGMYLSACSEVEAPRIFSVTCGGQPLHLGDPDSGTPGTARYVSNSHFGVISSKDVIADPVNPFNFPGNPIYLVGQNVTVDTMIVGDADAGIKIDRPGEDVQIGFVFGDTCTTDNSGLKLQGDGTGYPKRVQVGHVHMVNQYGCGLWMNECYDCTVGTYVGENNGTGLASPDVWIAGVRSVVGQIKSVNAGIGGLLIRDDAVDYTLGVVDVYNANRSASASTNGVTVGATSKGSMGTVQVIDDGTPAVRHDNGFRITVNSSIVKVDKLKIRGHIGAAYQIASGSAVAAKNLVVSGADTHLRIGLAAEAETVPPNVQVFAASGTWTKPTGVTLVTVAAIGAGGGGGSGRRFAATNVRCGGGGGGGGGHSILTFAASTLSATETVSVSATGGAGGSAVAVNDTDGSAGGNGGATIFGSRLRAQGGNGGGGGTVSTGVAGAAGAGQSNGSAGAAASVTGGTGNTGGNGPMGAAGGGSGGGISSGDVASAGGAGGAGSNFILTGGTAGPASTNGGAGQSQGITGAVPGSGGGGGGASTTTLGGTGGAGGTYGSGGGGGGASLNGNASGAGGIGAGGICVVASW